MTLLAHLWEGLQDTSPLEWIADATGVTYALLVMRHKRLGWVLGGISSAILTLLAWRAQKVMTYAGYILGFPTDTPESIARDIDIIKKELPIDLLEFFYLTPLPGSEDHKKLHMAGIPMDIDPEPVSRIEFVLNWFDELRRVAPRCPRDGVGRG